MGRTVCVSSVLGHPDANIATGTVVHALPAHCDRVRVRGSTYHRCDHIYYAPRYQGSNLVYVAVDAP